MPLNISNKIGIGEEEEEERGQRGEEEEEVVVVMFPINSSSLNILIPKNKFCNPVGGHPGNFFSIIFFKSRTVAFLGIDSLFFLSKKTDPIEVDTTIAHTSGCVATDVIAVFSDVMTSAPPRNRIVFRIFLCKRDKIGRLVHFMQSSFLSVDFITKLDLC